METVKSEAEPLSPRILPETDASARLTKSNRKRKVKVAEQASGKQYKSTVILDDQESKANNVNESFTSAAAFHELKHGHEQV